VAKTETSPCDFRGPYKGEQRMRQLGQPGLVAAVAAHKALVRRSRGRRRGDPAGRGGSEQAGRQGGHQVH